MFCWTLKLKKVLNKPILQKLQNLKQPQSGINIRMYACASPVSAGDAGGAGGAEGAGGVCRRYIWKG